MEPSLTDMTTWTIEEKNRDGGCGCVFMCKQRQDWSRFFFFFAQSLLFACSADTLLQLQFYGVTFVYFMCCTDWLVHTMQSQIVKHG